MNALPPEHSVRSRWSSERFAEVSVDLSPWQKAIPGKRLADGSVVRAVTGGISPAVVLEREGEQSGELFYVGGDGPITRIRKVLGAVITQPSPPPIVHYANAFWQELGGAKNDFLAQRLLSKNPDDPTFRQIQGLFPRLSRPETFVGRIDRAPSVVTVAADGSVSMDSRFFSGSEHLGEKFYSPFLRFRLNGSLVSAGECEGAIARGLLNGWLPATEFTYRQAETKAGWEELVLSGLYHATKGIFIRFRIANLSAESKVVTFALEGPTWGGSLDLSSDGITVITPLRAGDLIEYPPGRRLQEASLHQLKSPLRVPVSTNLPHTVEDGHAVWSFGLAPDQSEDLYFFLPGGDKNGPSASRLAANEVAPAFYAALKNEYDTWSQFIAAGSQISLPEPGLQDVFNATLIQTMISVYGNEPRGGFVHYDGYWPFCTLHQIRLMLDTGHPDYARRYLEEFMRHRIRDDGRFWLDEKQSRYQVSDAGDFLAVLARYYWQTRDSSLIKGRKAETGRVIAMIRRERAACMKSLAAGNPRRGMIVGSIENDLPDPDYLYTNNTPICAGLRDYAEALGDVATITNDPALAAEAAELGAYAAAYRRQLRASFESYALEHDASGKPYFFSIAPNDDGQAARYRTNPVYNAYRRFQCQPRMMATDFLTDDEIRGFYKYQSENDSTILGVRRWKPDVLDDFVSFDCDFQRARLGMSREYLMKFFAYLQCLAGNGTWTAFEEDDVSPTGGRRGRVFSDFEFLDFLNGYDGQHATCAIPKMAKDLFAVDEPGGGIVWLAGGVSRNWLARGQPVTATKLGSRYGLIDLGLRYDSVARSTAVAIQVEPGRKVPEIRVRLRGPQGGKLASTDCAAVRLLIDQDVAVLKALSGSIRFTVKYAKP